MNMEQRTPAETGEHSLAKSEGMSITFSVLMIVAGCLAILVPIAAGIAVNVLVAWLLVFSGAAHFVFAWHARRSWGIAWEVFLGILYVGVGIFLLLQPLVGLASLTISLALYLLAQAGVEVALAIQLRRHARWGWLLVDGLMTMLIALLIFTTWPASTEWVIGTLVGVTMIFSGVTRLMLSLASRETRRVRIRTA
jgi:uncharacterized membrane protein HdeD (DUF308 family)